MINLKEKRWCKYKIDELFKCNIAKSTDFGKTLPGDNVFVGRQSCNNGIQGFVSNDIVEKGNCISIAMVGENVAYYQANDFVASQNILVLRSDVLNERIALFLNNCIQKQLLKYSYGKPIGLANFKNQYIMLPANNQNNPDYLFMESYMFQMEKDLINKEANYMRNQLLILGEKKQILKLTDCKWKKFNVKDVFETIQRGKRLKKEDHILGDTPYVSSTSLNNGVDRFIGNENNVRKFNNCLSLANSGSVGSCFYEPFEFIASDHVTHLKNEKFNKYHYLFIASILNRLSDKYNFNREINDARISKEILILPTKNDITPDFEYMEQYAKNILIDKYSKLLEFII